jgi:transaldolase/glucose-6-phosphate isomerase
MFRYFYERVGEITDAPGRHFIAITDPGTPLEVLAHERRVRFVFTAIPDVGGRYSALTAFGLVPATLIGIDPEELLGRAGEMAGRCSDATSPGQNPGLVLGATLGETSLAGKDKVTFITSPSLHALPDWLEQLIAESTGKDGKGIIPVAAESLGGPETYSNDRSFVYIYRADEAEDKTKSQVDLLGAAGHPVVLIGIRDNADIAGEMFRWELAVASAGAVMRIHPFNQPDVQDAKDLARKAMKEGQQADRATDPALSAEASAALAGRLNHLLGRAGHGDYFAIQAYLAPTPEVTDALQDIRHHVRDKYRLATTFGYGPRFLHSTGQLHKGGPNTGIFLQLVDSPAEDVSIPGTAYTFGDLIRAQALGDYQALIKRNRRVLRVNLGKDPTRGLDLLQQAMP